MRGKGDVFISKPESKSVTPNIIPILHILATNLNSNDKNLVPNPNFSQDLLHPYVGILNQKDDQLITYESIIISKSFHLFSSIIIRT
jgi:hypothetical protein